MKCKSLSTKELFQPVTISLTFESQAELDAFGTLMNTSPIVDTLANSGFPIAGIEQIRNELIKMGSDVHQIQGFVDELVKHPCIILNFPNQ